MKSLQIQRNHSLDYPEMPQYPRIYVDSKQMSEIGDWEVGETYELKVKIKMTGKTETENRVDGNFDVIAYERTNKKSLS